MKKLILILVLAGLAFYMFGKDESEIKNVGNPGLNVVAFGDSLSYGYGAPRGRGYPERLAEKINRPIVNLGRNGETAAQAPQRLEEVLAQNPYMVLIEFGGNDFMRSVPFEQTLAAIEQITDAVQAAGAVAVIVDTGGYNGMSRYSKAYKKIGQEKGALFVPGILNGVAAKRELMSDQVHPNAAGYQIVADKVYEAIKDYL